MVYLGPIEWRPLQFQSELNSLGVKYKISSLETGYIKIDDHYEIFPIWTYLKPSYDQLYETLTGPIYQYFGDHAIQQYGKTNLTVEQVKAKLITLASAERYRKQNLGTSITIKDVKVTLVTTQDELNKFVVLSNTVGNSIINWKFPETFVELSLAEVQDIINTIHSYIQSQFDWEKSINDQIKAASTIEELKEIVIAQTGETGV